MFHALVFLFTLATATQAQAAPQQRWIPLGSTLNADGSTAADCFTIKTETNYLPEPILNVVIAIDRDTLGLNDKNYLSVRTYLHKGYLHVSKITLNPLWSPLKTASIEDFKKACGEKVVISHPLGNLVELSYEVDNSLPVEKLEHWVMGADELNVPNLAKKVEDYRARYNVAHGPVVSWFLKDRDLCIHDSVEECFTNNVPKLGQEPALEMGDLLENPGTVDLDETFIRKIQRESN